MPTFRKERMSEAIRKVVTSKLLRDASPIPEALVTISRVEVTSDFSLAKIFFSVFGKKLSEEEASLLMKGFQSEYRYEISQKLKLRRTPRIEFCFDRNTAYAFKIEKLINS